MRLPNSVRLIAMLALALSSVPAAAAPLPLRAVLTAQALAQSAKSTSTAADRKEVETLLRRARDAMKSGKFETADSLISRAEAMNVEYGLFHIGDTPRKARKEFDAAQGSDKQAPRSAKQTPQRPSQQFSPSAAPESPAARTRPAAEDQAEAVVPLRSRNASPRTIDQPPIDDDDRLPSLTKAAAPLDTSPFSRPTQSVPPASDDGGNAIVPRGPRQTAAVSLETRRQSDGLLLSARKSLAVGDVRRASAAVEQAKNLQVPYGFHDDSPAKVETLVRKYVDVVESVARDNTEAARQQYAGVLMEEAQHLMRWKDFDEAERLAADASRLKVAYGPFEAKPEALLEKIAAARKQLRTGPSTAPGMPGLGDESRHEPTGGAAGGVTGTASEGGKRQALELTSQARKALAAGNIDQAGQLARQAEGLKVPESAFGPRDDRPWMVALEIQKARYRNLGVTPAGGTQGAAPNPSRRAVYNPQRDNTHTRLASGGDEAAEDPSPEELPSDTAGSEAAPLPFSSPNAKAEASASPGQGTAMELILAGEQAQQRQDRRTAAEMFRRAYDLRDQLDPAALQRLQDHLQLLAVPSQSPKPAPPSLLDAAVVKQQLAAKQLSADVGKQEAAARKLQAKEPQKALEMLKAARAQTQAAQIDAASKGQVVRRVDRSIAELSKHIEENRSEIELDAHNKGVLDEIDRNRRVKGEVDEKLAKLVNEFNTLLDEERYAEAEVVAKRAKELDHNNPVVKQLETIAKFIRRKELNDSVGDRKERGNQAAWESVVDSSTPIDDREPYQFPDAKKWQQLSQSRKQQLANSRSHLNERELEIQRKLRTPVLLKFRDKPLSQVLEQLAKLAAVNMHLDPQGLSEEGVASDQPVTLDLTQEISLKSALNLILGPLHLNYVIKDEVLKITSEQHRSGQVYPVTYNVGDLVIPVPNFTPNGRIGLAGAIADAYGSMRLGSSKYSNAPAPVAVASQTGAPSNAVIDPAVLAQMNQLNPGAGSGGGTGTNQPIGFGPGGVGGGSQADFESLIELITTTIAPQSWDDNGGPGSIKEFETNLSLVIRQTQDIHEEIVDLLEQLRKNQDLQVTIEVRFITLNDNFFERIGVDFDFNIDDNVRANPALLEDQGPSVTVGLQDAAPGSPFPNFTADLDIPFRQESFTLATPQFGQPVDVARFGFAILSDIEAYFLVAAAQGDRRSNVLQAPKVTMFNGQQAIVSDTSQTPFVISVIPVVGDFAAAQQPVIVVLSEGTFLTVQAVVTEDRRFVRLTVVPFFSQIGDVEEFTFSGSRTTTRNTSADQQGDDTTSATDDQTVSTEGVTVQLPTFSFVTVTTTVSVPDGGTVLLGGIKRLSEGRNEFGVPILSKLPYINRLFKNVGIGRETQSLMMMVTPRIIIQEEEEERLGITPANP